MAKKYPINGKKAARVAWLVENIKFLPMDDKDIVRARESAEKYDERRQKKFKRTNPKREAK